MGTKSDPTWDWVRLIDAVVEWVRAEGYWHRWANAARLIGTSEGSVRRWCKEGNRAIPRDEIKAALLTFAARTWPDYETRFTPKLPTATDAAHAQAQKHAKERAQQKHPARGKRKRQT